MKKNPTRTADAAMLRRRAEEQLRERRTKAAKEGDADPQRLIHELEVHQTELELQNEELRAARCEIEVGLDRYTAIFEFAPIGYFVMTDDGTIHEANLAGARLLGMERRRFVGRRFGQFIAQGQVEAFNDFLHRVLTKDDPGSESCELSLAGEGTKSSEVRLTAAGLKGSPLTALVAVEDVTERKRAEAALREENRRKDEFLGVLSHELRNPLAPIRNSLFVLERAEPHSEQARKAQAIINRQLAHLTHIVDDLLDVTRIAQGKIRLQRARLELGDLLRRTIDDHRPSFEMSGIELEARFGSELFWVYADATRLVQVFGNLLGNAAKFTDRGGRVEVVLRRQDESVVVSVWDTGTGIAPELREHLFEPFSQAPQTLDRTRGGLGLGLASVKGLIELHGGTVGVTSEGLGRGSEFTITLPLTGASARVGQPAAKHQTLHYRVLVIEDHEDAADSLRNALELGGHDVQIARDGPTALRLAREFRPEIVICDIGLPGMNGYEVARAFRADDILKSSYLIGLSGYARPEDLQRAAEAEFDCYRAKPLGLDELEELFAEAHTSAMRGSVNELH